MPHPEIALHPIHGPDGTTAYPTGHPLHTADAERLPDDWDRDFVDEMIAGGYAAAPDSEAARAVGDERAAVGPVETTVVETGMRS